MLSGYCRGRLRSLTVLLSMQFGQRYVEEQDDKTVTEWMRKQVLLNSSPLCLSKYIVCCRLLCKTSCTGVFCMQHSGLPSTLHHL